MTAPRRRVVVIGAGLGGRAPAIHLLRRVLTAAPELVGLRREQTADAFLGQFFQEPRVRQAFGAPCLLVGANPQRAPAALATLAYVALDQGVWYAAGGFRTVVEELGQ